MGEFDDLIPKGKKPAGQFADLVPKERPVLIDGQTVD